MKTETAVPAVHNHGPEEGPGLNCPEFRVLGRLVGGCRITPENVPARGFPLALHADEQANPLDRWCTRERFEALENLAMAVRELLAEEDPEDYTELVPLALALEALESVQWADLDHGTVGPPAPATPAAPQGAEGAEP